MANFGPRKGKIRENISNSAVLLGFLLLLLLLLGGLLFQPLPEPVQQGLGGPGFWVGWLVVWVEKKALIPLQLGPEPVGLVGLVEPEPAGCSASVLLGAFPGGGVLGMCGLGVLLVWFAGLPCRTCGRWRGSVGT